MFTDTQLTRSSSDVSCSRRGELHVIAKHETLKENSGKSIEFEEQIVTVDKTVAM